MKLADLLRGRKKRKGGGAGPQQLVATLKGSNGLLLWSHLLSSKRLLHATVRHPGPAGRLQRRNNKGSSQREPGRNSRLLKGNLGVPGQDESEPNERRYNDEQNHCTAQLRAARGRHPGYLATVWRRNWHAGAAPR